MTNAAQAKKLGNSRLDAKLVTGLTLGALFVAALVFFATGGQSGGLFNLQGSVNRLAAAGGTVRPPQQLPMIAALANCKDFACLRAAHAQPRGSARFNFPHFFIIGYPKCGTTSLHAYLAMHPQGAASQPKEPQFFTRIGNCSHPKDTVLWECDPQATESYLIETLRRDEVVASGLNKAAFEGSVEYAGRVPTMTAVGIRRELPWLKIIVNMREPISHAISGQFHSMEMVTNENKPEWFVAKLESSPALAESMACLERLHTGEARMYECLSLWMAKQETEKDMELDVTSSLKTWLHAYPREQLYVVQMENLTSLENNAAVLKDVQRFVGMDPDLAPDATGDAFPTTNSRKQKNTGWPMKRHEYEALLVKAKAAAYPLAAMLEQHNFMPAKQWLANWEAAWQRNLDSCDENGDCMIQVT